MPCRFSSGPAESVGKLYTFTGSNNYVQLNQRLARVAQKLLLIAYSNYSRDLSMKRLLAAAIATFSCLTAFAGAITLTGTALIIIACYVFRYSPTGIRTTVVDDALSCAAFGSGKMLMNLNDMPEGMVNLARKRQMKA